MDNESEHIYLISAVENNQAVDKPVESAQVNLESVENFANVCRTCATITEFVIPIFEQEGHNSNLAEKIHRHLPIHVSEQDEMPQVICFQCASTLLAWHELVECCMQADAALKTRLAVIAATPKKCPEPTAGPSSEEAPKQGSENEQQAKFNSCRSFEKNSLRENEADNSLNYLFHRHRTKTLHTQIEIKQDLSDNDCWDVGSQESQIKDETLQSDEDDQPLSSLAAQKSTKDTYTKFYKALIKFRNHYVSEHNIDTCSYPDLTETSDSETEPNQESLKGDDSCIVDEFDDLTKYNMRKDKMDEETRLELNEVQVKINGKVFYTCKLCGKNLSSSHTYVFHKRIHTGERPCVCHVCGKQFRAPNGLQRHLTETHEQIKRHGCPVCAKNFANSQNLKQHMRIHTGEKPFVCTHCGKRFTQSGSLHVHLKTHSEHYPHHCAECGAKFRLRSGLTRHKLKHTGERPHVCAHCGKSFRQKHELNSHVLAHSDVKPHSCAVCGAAFRLRRALRHHCKKVHETAARDNVPQSIIYTHVGQYEELAEYVAQTLDGEFEESARDTEVSQHACEYCPFKYRDEPVYQSHLLTEHAELLFQCDECNKFVNRKDLIMHMSIHAIQYALGKENEMKPKLNEEAIVYSEEIMSPEPSQPEQNENDIDTGQNLSHLKTQSPHCSMAANEFSDHTDTEDGFGPLPVSVFEAIEDSQDDYFEEKLAPIDSPQNIDPPVASIDSPQKTKPPDAPVESDQKTEPPVAPKDSIQKTESPVAPIGSPLKKESLVSPIDSTQNKEPLVSSIESSFTPISSLQKAKPQALQATNEKKAKTKKFTRVCPICGKVYKVSSSYFYHMKMHKSLKEFECDVCARKFADKSTLQQHLLLHDEKLKYKCEQCGRLFRTNASLYIHTQYHIGKKEFSCKQCDKSFRWRQHLLRHMTRHSAEKVHVCSSCGRGFSVRCDLLRHMRTHNAGNHHCDKCGAKFAQLRYLKAHVDKKHTAISKDNVDVNLLFPSKT